MVPVDNRSGWPTALFLPNSTTHRVIEFLTEFIATNGIPKRIGTDPGTAFKSQKFKQFCGRYFIEHIICPLKDHRGNVKVERMIRTINERLRTNKKIVSGTRKKGIIQYPICTKVRKRVDGKSAFEKHMGRKPNSQKSGMIGKFFFRQRLADRNRTRGLQ